MAKSLLSKLIEQANKGSVIVQSNVAGELNLPIEVVDEQGKRTVNVTLGSHQKRDLAKAVPAKALITSGVVRKNLLNGKLALLPS